jgi:DNA-binding MarR family transcriptional regulator
VLWEHGPQIVSEIGERLFLDSATLTPLLKRLEGAGLIRRSRTPRDERQVEISLTDEGRKLQQAAPDIQRAIFQATRCSASEQQHLRDALGRLRKSLLEQG